jgi:integrase
MARPSTFGSVIAFATCREYGSPPPGAAPFASAQTARMRISGSPADSSSLTHQFIYLTGRTPDLPRLRFHDLRHSHATQQLVEGIHPKVVQERLGHSSIAITLDLYSHVIGTLQEDAAARLDFAFGPAIRLSLTPKKTE